MGRKKGDTYIHKWNTGVRERKKKNICEGRGWHEFLSLFLPSPQVSHKGPAQDLQHLTQVGPFQTCTLYIINLTT